MPDEASRLIHDVESAFSGACYPGDGRLAPESHGEEPEALRREFAGKRDWCVLDAAFLDQAPEGWATALSFFSDEAFRFYLPAYLVADIKGELQNVTPAFSLCWGLSEPEASRRIARQWGGGTIGERRRQQFDGFNDVQVAVIVRYLRLAAGRDADTGFIEPALRVYWEPRNEAAATPPARRIE